MNTQVPIMLIPYDTRGHGKVDGALEDKTSPFQPFVTNLSIETCGKKMHKQIISIVDWRFLTVNSSKTVTRTLYYTTKTI
jgi:hypothetical protein